MDPENRLAASERGVWRSAELLILVLFTGLLFFISLGARDLWNPNEPTYGRAVVEMDQRGDWMIPTVNDKVFAEKPILYYWLALVSSKLFGGVDELTLRIPSALAGLGSAVLTFLLIVPYAGRRRALIGGLIFATCYQVFWAARAIQMDIWVLLTTLGVLVPLTRMLDFELSPRRAWVLAGISAGIGFTAKGPVTWILPAVVFTAYVVARKEWKKVLTGPIWIPVVVALVVSSPWYLILWFQGEVELVHEVLIRQNFHRFVDAWDHLQPWWYYLEYVWVDYAPWALLLPAAVWLRPLDEREANLHKLSWLWIVGIIGFFSLSESKRAPYILPVAPAVAVLASGVVDRWLRIDGLPGASKNLTRLTFGCLATLFVAAAAYLLGPWLELPSDVPPELGTFVTILALLFILAGIGLWVGIFGARKMPALAPATLLGAMVALYLLASIWILPLVDAKKSARGFASAALAEVEYNGGNLVSYDFWDWRAGYSFYMDRPILNLKTKADLEEFWSLAETPYILAEGEMGECLQELLPDSRVVVEEEIGSRLATLLRRRGPEEPAGALAANGEAIASQ